jgi:2-polyprenyl-3-methyl-5-hydroxy-6-metoxy-1,4-benzoquinol methylase
VDFQERSIKEVQDYWNARPCNIRHSPREVGSREYFDEVEARKYFVEPHIPLFAEFERWYGKKVLEIGCGIGTDTINFARHGAMVTAIDVSSTSLDIARKRAEVFGLQDQIRFYCGSAEVLSTVIPPARYDLIYSFGVIHHTPNPEKVLEQIRAFTKPGTEIRIMVYNKYSWKVFWILLKYGKGRFWQLEDLVAKYSEAQTGCPITYTYSKTEIRRLMEKYGFSVQDIFIDHIFPYSIPEYVNYRYVRVWYLRWMPRSLFRWFERHLGWHLCVTAIAE